MDTSKTRIAVILFIMCIILYLYNRIKRKYYNNTNKAGLTIRTSNKLKENKYPDQCISKQIVDKTITHKEILLKLHDATDKCYMTVYALKCIQLVNYCPHLINIPHGLDGYTPFHRVCFHGNTCLIEYMLAKGANPFLTTYTGENAICIALYYFLKNPSNTDFTCLNILCEAGCHLDTPNVQYDIFIKAALNTNNKLLAEWILLHSKIGRPLRSYSEPQNFICHTF
ncbi:hypothetical protein KPH14_007528 [Odynerus spinipes]|uniref:Ankyrin repeat protein n=1 Tax=Odynerus spinipes TaxID=1348599 RepID=A0AAD9VMB1_9HYME|nr:hypothetical protein KPH14_007528 [Odynerus spinipes]